MQTVPAYLNRFVGRQRERTEVRQLLATERLVTLFGVGGVGKTRLAAEVATRMEGQYRDGVCFLELDQLRDGALLTQHLAEALDIRELEAQSSGDALATALTDRKMLLVLDNCEHLVNVVGALVQRILLTAPGIRVLLTSRQVTGGSGEYVFHLDPLAIPSQAPDAFTDLYKVDSVALFVDRARSVAPSFELDASTEEAVSALCAQLDGIPLAIELAAVRMSVLSIDDLLERLSDRFSILRKTDPSAPERHQTLQALIDWSYDLCDAQERTLWSRVSIFAGSFGLDAIEGVCRLDNETSVDIFEAVSTLVDKGILVRDHGAGGRTRYRMLETIRQYGESIVGDERDMLRERHLDWYHQLARRARQDWMTGPQAVWIDRLRQEYGNIRAALEYASRSGVGASKGIDLVVSLRVFWMAAGFLGEGRHWLQRLQQVSDVSNVSRGFALMLDGWFAVYEGRTTESAGLIAEAAAIAAQTNDPALEAYSHYVHGLYQLFNGEFDEASSTFWDAHELFEQLGDQAGVLLCLVQVALRDASCADPDSAVELCERALTGLANDSEGWFRSYILWAYGMARWQIGEYDAARDLERKSIAIKGGFGEKFGIALSLEVLAWVEAASGSYERAATLFGLLDAMFTTLGVQLSGFKHLISHHKQAMTQSRANLPQARFEQSFRKGQLLGFERGVEFAFDLPPHTGANARLGGLTPREIEVAGLIALGLSSREIASKLTLSVRTAEAHTQHILSKMAFSSRAQIASWYTASTRSDAQ